MFIEDPPPRVEIIKVPDDLRLVIDGDRMYYEPAALHPELDDEMRAKTHLAGEPPPSPEEVQRRIQKMRNDRRESGA